MKHHYNSIRLLLSIYSVFLLSLNTAFAQQGSRMFSRTSFQGGIQYDSAVSHYANANTPNAFETIVYSDPRGAAFISAKNIHIYNAQGQQIKNFFLLWNAGKSIFDTISLTSYAYDAFGNRTLYQTQNKDTVTSQYINSLSINSVFNAANRETKRTTLKWRISGSIWDTLNQLDSVFNVQGKVITYLKRTWNSTTHKLSTVDSFIFTYNGSGQGVLQVIGYKWTLASGVYTNDTRTNNTLNALEQVVTGITEGWNAASSTWKQGGKHLYTYTPNGYIASDTIYTWDVSTSSYKLNSRILILIIVSVSLLFTMWRFGIIMHGKIIYPHILITKHLIRQELNRLQPILRMLPC